MIKRIKFPKGVYQIINRTKKVMHAKLFKSRYSYFILGNWTVYLLQILATFLLTRFLGWWYMLSYGTALLVGILLLFFYHENVTFRVRHPIFKENSTRILLKFLTWAGLLIAVSWTLVFILAHILGLYYLLAIALTGPVLSLFNYYVNKRWVFQGWKPKRAVKRDKWVVIKNLRGGK